MKIVVTGSLGHISKPLAQELIKNGHQVTIISSQSAKQKEIEDLGASAAIGRLEDVDFLTTAFTGADAVYSMTPPPQLFDSHSDLVDFYVRLGQKYLDALRQSEVKRVVHLSSVGGHTDKENGILRYAYEIEQILTQLPAKAAITFMRPVGFYYNLLAFIPAIKAQGIITSNYGGDDKKPWVSPIDIAAACFEELTASLPEKRKIRYVASDELSCNEVAHTLGAAIGKPDLEWRVISDKEMLDRLTEQGMNPNTAQGFVEMNASMRSGKLYEDYNSNKPALGKVKIADFAQDFAKAYHQK